MSMIMDTDGRVVDNELNVLGLKVQAEINNLFKMKTDWTLEQKIVAAYHVQGHINSEVMRVLMEGIIKKQGGMNGLPSLKPNTVKED